MSDGYRRAVRASRLKAEGRPMEPDVERELQRWKTRASRLRHALLEISAGVEKPAAELRDIAKDAVNFETSQ
jgi:hypothetical protein